MPWPGALRRLVPLVLGVAAPGLASCGSPPPRPSDGARADAVEHTTTTSTSPPSTEEQVRRAYLASWHARARAMQTLDASHLECCYAGETLATLYRSVDRHARDRHKVRVHATHDIDVLMIGADRAVVTDHAVESSVLYDADTGRDLEPTPHDVELLQFTLERLEGVWKVVFTIRY